MMGMATTATAGAHHEAIHRDATPEGNTLGFAKTPSATRVIVAMSGGVDSSVVAAMLHEQGYDVIGITLQLYDQGAALGKKGACCAGQDIRDARRIADEMGFPHYVLDYESIFRESVIDEFADSYLAGATPIPCIRCNERVKFTDLLKTARDLGGDCLATGHYIRRIVGQNGVELHRARDLHRDQSYFLFSITRPQLDYLRFPLGELNSKDETRHVAQRLGLSVAHKPDSQDICFVPNGNYAEVIKKLRPEAADPGDIVDLHGKWLGKHDGIINFTVGQRRRLGIGGTREPLYVVRLDAQHRQVVVGPKSALLSSRIHLREVSWLGDQRFTPGQSWNLRIKIRSTGSPTDAIVFAQDNGTAKVQSLMPLEGVSPGQACVFYMPEGNRVLGGGWIQDTTSGDVSGFT